MNVSVFKLSALVQTDNARDNALGGVGAAELARSCGR